MFMIIDAGATLNVTQHPINIFTGAVQNHTAYLANFQNVTKSSGKVIINQVISLAAPSATAATYQIRTIDDSPTPILQVTTGGNVACQRNTLASPIEIDQPIAIRFTAGTGLFYIDYDMAEI